MNQIVCQRHNLPLSQIIMFTDKAELICEECFVNLIDRKKQIDLENVIYLRKSFLSFVKNQSQRLEKEIRLIQNQLEMVLEEIKSHSQFVITMRQELLIHLKQAMKFEQLQSMIDELGKQNDSVNPDIINQIEQKFFTYFNSIKNEKVGDLKQSLQEVLEAQLMRFQECPQKQVPEKNNQFLKLVKEFNDHHQYFFISTKPENAIAALKDSKIISLGYANSLYSQIESKSNKRIKKNNLIYSSTKDGLNVNSFWTKVNGKKHLLMFFKSDNDNQIFGGYSPCQWSQHHNNYISDETVSSFLFSEKNDEIYPLKQDQKQYAIWCSTGYGPYFGYNGDLNISADFKCGSSNLGNTYQWEQYQGGNSNHIYGGGSTNITECEIYEIIFE